MLRRTLSLLAATIPAVALAQVPPEKAVSTLKVAEGLQVELFASEPDVINPTSIDVDHLGRVWVCEAVNYRRINFGRPILRPEGDRIVILEDTKGVGKADKATVFYQGKEIIAPIGICVVPIPSPSTGEGKGGGDGKNTPHPNPPPQGGREPNPPQGGREQKRPSPSTGEGKGGGDRSRACRVFVCQSPDILVFEDLDGDGKADGPPKKFLTGFKGFDHDHGVHGINIGPDGKLYFTVGDQGVDGLQSSDGKGRKWKSNNTDCRAGTVWRCDMDGKNLELIAHNFRNNYECCVNSFGEIWLSDNDDDGNQQTRICYVMPGGDYGYYPRGPGQSHWHEEQPGIVHKVLRTYQGSPTGICFYEGQLLPKIYQGQLLHVDAGPNEFRCFHIKPKGAGYELEKEVLVTSSDSWCRFSDVCVAPDGSVMLADWYDPGVGGHGMGDWTRGRIFRVTPKGHVGYKVPKVDLNSTAGLLAAARSANLATRSLMYSLGPDAIAEKLADSREEIAKDSELSARLILLMARGYQYPLWIEAVSTYRQAADPKLRPMAERLIEEFHWNDHPTNRSLTFTETDVKWLDKYDNHEVMREMLIWMRKIENPGQILPLFYALAKRYDGQDLFYRAALNIACGTNPQRRAKILADFDKHFPELNDKTLDLIWELRPPGAAARLEKHLTDASLKPEQRGRIVDILAGSDDPAAGKALLSLLSTQRKQVDGPAIRDRAWAALRTNLTGKWSALAKSEEFKNLVRQLLASPQAAVGLQLIAASKDTAFLDDVLKVAKDGPKDLRVEAIRTLAKFTDVLDDRPIDTLIAISEPENEFSIECVKALAEQLPTTQVYVHAKDRALKKLQGLAKDTKVSKDLRLAAVTALAGNRHGSFFLLYLKQKNELPEDVSAEAARLLRNCPFEAQRNQAKLLFPPPGKLDLKKLPPISELAKRTGNADKGRQLVAASAKNEAQCLKCHTIRGSGGNVGPDLSMIGKKGSRENILESILLPSKAIADQYIQWQIETKQGQQILGLIIEETPDSILLRDANAKDYRIAKKDIDTRNKSLVSIMPDNIATAFTEEELLDVAEYLLTLKTASLTPETWLIAGPFPGGKNNAGLDREYPPDKMPFDANAKFDTKAGKQGWRTVRRNPDGYLDLAAFHGDAANDSVSFAYREIESPVDQDAEILLGTDDGANLYVNGKQVYSEKVTRAAAPEQARVAVKLKKGANTIILKIANGNNPHGFYFTIVSGEEVKVK
ncbi:MAG TPA: PVC-type heme-binding CxxCH protein [Gemmataceae bacterium]|nr:PVC-type heme-binding CxxCH protein [Gemmataceae bacterium]